MAQHGYLGDGYGMWGDFEEGHERGRERSWRDRGEGRGFMFDRDRGRGDDSREWFGGRSRDERISRYGPEHGYGGFQGDYSGGRQQGGFGGAGDYQSGRTSFSSQPDDHYRSWRQKQIDALDRDYADYCREREQQFHRDFDIWRAGREQGHGNPQPLQTGMTQSGLSADPTGMTQMAETSAPPDNAQDPAGTATLGTTSGGRARR